ncbi:hypothetical protein DFH28DRAFT_207219 [Melampsora americana]|nr:hypothetical protein DFH28DRAFT_207219 [Melampsora americana]
MMVLKSERKISLTFCVFILGVLFTVAPFLPLSDMKVFYLASVPKMIQDNAYQAVKNFYDNLADNEISYKSFPFCELEQFNVKKLGPDGLIEKEGEDALQFFRGETHGCDQWFMNAKFLLGPEGSFVLEIQGVTSMPDIQHKNSIIWVNHHAHFIFEPIASKLLQVNIIHGYHSPTLMKEPYLLDYLWMSTDQFQLKNQIEHINLKGLNLH